MKEMRLGRNATYFTGALIIQKILSFVYFWFISNNIMPSVLGRYVFALSCTSLFSIFVDLGLTPILIRESSKNRKDSNSYLKNIISLKLPLTLITLFVLIVFINFSGKPEQVKTLVYLASIIMLLDSFTVSFWGIFRSYQNMLYESIATIIIQIIIFVLGITALKATGNIVFIMSALVCASLFNFTYSLFLLKLKLKFSLRPSWDWGIIKYFLSIVPAFALSGIFVKIYNSADSVLLSFLASDKAVGLYSIPTKTITSLSQIMPAAFAAAIFPVFSKNYIESKEKLKINFIRSLKYLIILSLPITGGLAVLIPHILRSVWPSYQEAATAFIIMSFAVPFIFLAFSTGYLLNACDKQKYNMVNRGVMALLTVLLNIILIPFFSFLGSGIVFLVVNVLVFIMDMIWIPKIFNFRFSDISKILTKSLIASIIMVGAAYCLLQFVHFVFVILISVFLYFGILFATRAINMSEIKKLITYEKDPSYNS